MLKSGNVLKYMAAVANLFQGLACADVHAQAYAHTHTYTHTHTGPRAARA